MTKSEQLAAEWGMSLEQMLQEATFDSVAAGICMNPGCNYTTEVEPDCRSGLCEICDTQTVSSCLVIEGMI